MSFHKDLTDTDIHALTFQTFADQAARLAYSYQAADVHKMVYQTDTGTYFLVKSTTPTFQEIGAGGGGGSSTFTGLTDTPANYTGHAEKVVKVNAGETAVEFTTPGNLELARVSGSTFSTIQHLQDIFHSSGVISGGQITDDTDGTITVAAGTGLIRATNSETAEIKYTDWAAESGANVALTDNDMNYVYVEWNAGTPQVIASITERTDYQTNILLGTVYRSGTTLHITEDTRPAVGDQAAKIIRRLTAVVPFARESGGVISETGTRSIAISAGIWWEGLTQFSTAAFNSSVSDTFRTFYWNGTSWVETASQTQIDNTQYNDFGVGLATLSNNAYGVHWIYLAQDGDVYSVYGQGDYTLSQAQESVPNGVPGHFAENHARLVGKVIIKKNSSSFTQLDSAFDLTLSPVAASEHSSLLNLGADDHTQYSLISSQAGAPTSTPSRVGEVNVDTTADDAYISAGTGSSSDWKLASETATSIKTKYESNADTNAFTDAEQTKVGYLTVTQAVDLDTMETDIATNNAKVSNATHTGEVTGSGALTVDKTAITNKTLVTAASTDHVLVADSSDLDNLKKVLVSDLQGSGTDNDAIHDNVAGEIALITEKVSPVSADLLVIEDSADTNNKKRIQVGNIPHDSLSGFVANEHIDWTAASAGTIHATNYVDNDTTDHALLTNKGTNTHAQIDSHIADADKHRDILQGVIASRPAFGTAGRYYYATDEKKWYYDTGAAWDLSVATPDTHTHTASEITDFDAEVSNNSDVSANTAKVSNATHTGDVTGSTALTIAANAADNTKISDMAQNTIKGRITAATGDPEDLTAAQVRTIINVEDGATADQTGAEIKTAYEAEANTNAYTDAEQTKVGHLTVTQAVDLDTMETDIATNNAKISNATHTGEVTGSGALTVDKTAITNKTLVTAVGTDHVLIADASDTDNLKKALVSDFLGAGTDNDAIHDNVAGEISLITEKASPVSADLLIIEDSADSNNKKRVQIGNLPGGGGGITIDSTAITSGASGRVLFENASNQVSESDDLYWDDTNSRLAIGNTSPSNPLHITDTKSVTVVEPTIELDGTIDISTAAGIHMGVRGAQTIKSAGDGGFSGSLFFRDANTFTHDDAADTDLGYYYSYDSTPTVDAGAGFDITGLDLYGYRSSPNFTQDTDETIAVDEYAGLLLQGTFDNGATATNAYAAKCEAMTGVTNFHGFHVDNQTASTSTDAFSTDMASGTGKKAINCTGTAESYLGGNLTVDGNNVEFSNANLIVGTSFTPTSTIQSIDDIEAGTVLSAGSFIATSATNFRKTTFSSGAHASNEDIELVFPTNTGSADQVLKISGTPSGGVHNLVWANDNASGTAADYQEAQLTADDSGRQNDTAVDLTNKVSGLTVTLTGGKRYKVLGNMRVLTASATPDILWSIFADTGSSVVVSDMSVVFRGAAVDDTSSAAWAQGNVIEVLGDVPASKAGVVANQVQHFEVQGYINVTTTGDITLVYAQGTDNGNVVTLKDDSWWSFTEAV